MSGVTDTGFQIKRLNEILDELKTDAESAYGRRPADDGVLGVTLGSMAERLADLWEAAEGLYNGIDLDTAEGDSLNRLGRLIGVSRLSASSSTLEAVFTGNRSTVIPAGTVIEETINNEQFATNAALTLIETVSGFCTGITMSVTVQNNTLYSVTLDGVTSNYTSDADATLAEILAGLTAAIQANDVSSEYSVSDDGTNLTVDSTNHLNSFVASVSANLTIDKVSARITATAVNTGSIEVDTDTATSIVSAVPAGVDSVTNPAEADVGQDNESDSDYRDRLKVSIAFSGKGTEDALRAELANITGVTSASVFNNDSDNTVDGRPPHSFEAVVQHSNLDGIADTIGQTIWDNKPLGIESVGNISATAVDTTGANQTVYYTRPTNRDAWVQVDYTKFDEETFPVTGEDLIKQAVETYGDTLALGVDVIPQRFFTEIFNTVPGIESLEVRIVLVDEGDPDPGAGYSTSRIAVELDEISAFDTARVAVTEV